MIEINGEYMTLTVDDKVIATAWFGQHAAGDGNGTWIVSSCPARLFTCEQAITALTVVELLETGYSEASQVPQTRSC